MNSNLILSFIILILIVYVIHLKFKLSVNESVFEYLATFYSSIYQCFEEYKKADKLDSDSSMNVKKESVKGILDICESARDYEEKLRKEFNIK